MVTIRETLKLSVGDNLKEHRTYRIWYSMRSRCKPWHHAASRYYSEGIRVCTEWEDFMCFLADMGHPPSNTHSIDRIDPRGNYEPSNCRWATKQMQSDNKRNVVLRLFNGELLTMKNIAAKTGINYHTLRYRLQSGLTLSKALELPVNKGARYA